MQGKLAEYPESIEFKIYNANIICSEIGSLPLRNISLFIYNENFFLNNLTKIFFYSWHLAFFNDILVRHIEILLAIYYMRVEF